MTNTDRQQEIEKIERDIKRDLKEKGLQGPKHVVKDLAVQVAMKRELEARWTQGEDLDLQEYTRMSNAIIRGFQSLGLLKGRTDGNGPKRHKKDGPADIGEYLDQKVH